MYWRRRFVLLAAIIALLVLVVLTVHAVRSNGAGTKTAQGSTGSPTASAVAPAPSSTTKSAPKSSAKSTGTPSGRSSAKPPSTSSTSAAPPPTCNVKSLAIASVVAKSSYSVGDTPLLQMQVTNTGSKPCVQDLADKQVEMRVYNGESRVWGSHDCQVQPGTQPRTLGPNMPVRVAITWSGRTSQPGCNGTRQRVGAGTYTLYTALAGHTAKATQFSIN